MEKGKRRRMALLIPFPTSHKRPIKSPQAEGRDQEEARAETVTKGFMKRAFVVINPQEPSHKHTTVHQSRRVATQKKPLKRLLTEESSIPRRDRHGTRREAADTSAPPSEQAVHPRGFHSVCESPWDFPGASPLTGRGDAPQGTSLEPPHVPVVATLTADGATPRRLGSQPSASAASQALGSIPQRLGCSQAGASPRTGRGDAPPSRLVPSASSWALTGPPRRRPRHHHHRRRRRRRRQRRRWRGRGRPTPHAASKRGASPANDATAAPGRAQQHARHQRSPGVE